MYIEWLLPTHESRITNDEEISARAKYHCFVSDIEPTYARSCNGTSLCNKYIMPLGYYEKIESGQLLQFPWIACKKCFEKWKNKFDIDC